jgi:hypothetical protein
METFEENGVFLYLIAHVLFVAAVAAWLGKLSGPGE